MIPYGLFKTGSKIHPHNECGICGESHWSKRKARSGWKKEVVLMNESDWDKLAEMFEAGKYGSCDDERRKSEKDLHDSRDKDGQSR